MRLVAMMLVLGVWVGFADDISLFGSGNRGMGGAGLAIIRDPSSQQFVNPAAAAYNRSFRLGAGNFDLQAEGAGFRRLLDEITIQQGSPVDLSQMGRVSRLFASEDSRIFLTGDLGITVSGVTVSAGAVGEVRFLPNADLRAWAAQSGNPADLGNATFPNPRGDSIALTAVSLPDVTAGIAMPAGSGNMALGARVRAMRVFYAHYIATTADLQAGSGGTLAPEMGGNRFLEKSTASVDFGALFHPNGDDSIAYAIVVENLIEPDANFAATDTQGQAINVFPFKRSVHLGSAMRLPTGAWLAADLIDVGNETQRQELRLGVEQPFGFGLYGRAGYASKTGWTVGLGAFGFNIAFAKKLPFQVSRSLRF